MQSQHKLKLERLFADQKRQHMENNFIEQNPSKSKVQGKILQWVQGKLIGQGTTGEVYEAMNIINAEMFVVKKIQLVHQFQGLDHSKVKALK